MAPKNGILTIGSIGGYDNTMPVVSYSSPSSAVDTPSPTYTPVPPPSASIGGSSGASNDVIAAALIKALNPGAAAINNMSLPDPAPLPGSTIIQPASGNQSTAKGYPLQAPIIYISAIIGIIFAIRYFIKEREEK